MPIPGVMPGPTQCYYHTHAKEKSLMNHHLLQAACQNRASGAEPALTQPVLDRLGFIAMRQRETAELLELFRARLRGAPSVLNPPPGQVNAVKDERDALPTGLDDLLTFVEDFQVANRDALKEIAARF